MANPYDQVPLGQQNDSLNAPDNVVNYADITRFQMISQYQQKMQNYPRSSSQYSRMLSQPRFQYGVTGQDTNFYQRQQEVSRNVYGAGIAKGGFDYGMYGITSSIASRFVSSAGIKGIAGVALGQAIIPAVASMAPLYFINKGVERTLERQRAMQSISADVEQYRDRVGMQGTSSSQFSALGSNLASSMYTRGQFFDPMKQQEILKYGLANDMLSGRGRGMQTGDIKTFEKNFKELLETVKQVTKTMKVTAEGAMSVVKEMQMGGFGTMGQIGSAMTSAKAFGSMSGLGTQNMLQIGQAGAQAAQGTPYTSVAGASMYMGGAAMAASMAKGDNIRSMQAVQMAGGVAQAGGIIAQTQMNIMKSGMGARVLASVMNQQGKLDTGALNNLLQGTQSGHEIVGRAARVAHGWGSSGRVMAKFNFSDAANEIAEDPIKAVRLESAYFNAWRSNKRGTRQAQAYAFAQNFVQGGEREQRVYAEHLLSGKGLVEMSAQMDVSAAVANEKGAYPSIWSRMMKRVEDSPVGNALIVGGSKSTNFFSDAWGGTGEAFSGTGRRISWGVGSAVETVVGQKIFDRRSIGNVEQGYKNLMGLNNVNLSNTALKELGGLNAVQRKAAGLITENKETLGWDTSLIANQSNEERARFYQTLRTVAGEGTSKSIANNATALRSLGMTGGIKNNAFYEKFKNASREQQMQVMVNMGNIASREDTSRLDIATKNLLSVNDYIGSLPAEKQQGVKEFIRQRQGMTKDEISIEMRRVGANSLEGQGLASLDKYRTAKTTIDQLNKVDMSMPGEIASYEMVRKGNQEQTLMKLGLSTVQSRYKITSGEWGWTSRKSAVKGLKRLSGGIDVDKDAVGALAAISQRVSEGKLDIYDESSMDKAEVNRIKIERSDLSRAFGLTGTWNEMRNQFDDKFGNYAKIASDNERNAKGMQAIVGKNQAAIKFLRYQGVSGELIQQTQQYLDVAAKGGILSNTTMSKDVAQVIASNLVTRTTASEVQKMGKSGELQQRMYNSSKTDIGSSSRIQAVMKEVNRISNATDKKDYYYEDIETGNKKTLGSREKTLKYALDKYDIESKVQHMNETIASEQSRGKSLNGVVSPPILNYWNNKWSL